MGALHAGHLQLVRAARERCRSVAASVFVNPMQFAPGEDFERYPRDYAGDREKLAAAGVDILFAPESQTMYPPGFSTIVDVGDIGSTYEGAVRPTHFRGVTTVVSKLLNVVQPDVLFVGQKDAQQTAVLRKLVRDLDFPVRVEIVPTVRESDGLALSSRNVYLSAEERAAAPSLHRALELMLEELRGGRDAITARKRAQDMLHSPGTWDYLDVVDMDTFAPLEFLRAPAFVIGAARFGATRLIDNLLVSE
jgi:pantoate--beta-alanine ligase